MAGYITINGVEQTEEQYPTVRHTEVGPYCGNCNRGWRASDDSPRVRHADGASVRMCYAVAKELMADATAELALDMATERFYEDRGYEESQAHDQWEAARGVLHPSFHVPL